MSDIVESKSKEGSPKKKVTPRSSARLKKKKETDKVEDKISENKLFDKELNQMIDDAYRTVILDDVSTRPFVIYILQVFLL